ncbi:MAG: HEPN domain-containing protein [Prevotella sp.]|nr:HEPN domain-containing protein [Candidatus Prevotella equi]
MKETLSTEDRAALVKYRMERSDATMQEAEYSALGGWYNLAVSRLYYACYYAAVAVLISKSVETQSHSGVRSMMALHLVKEGLLAKEHLTTFTALFHSRQSSDYDDFIMCDADTYNDYLPKAKSCIEALKRLI